MRKLLQAAAIGLLCASGAACASASAKSKDVPPLNVPPPPPRVIEPAPEPMPEPVSDLPPAPTTTTPAAPKPNRPRETPRPANADPKANEQKPTEPPPEPAPVAQPPSQPPAQLRTPQTADSENATRNVRTTIDKTNTLLKGVDYQTLSKFRQKAYNDAQRFVAQAEEALKQGNYVFAQAVATKAETLARELSGK